MLHKLKPSSVFALAAAATLLMSCQSPSTPAIVRQVMGGKSTAAPAPPSDWNEQETPLRLAALFSDNMVLQQNAVVPVWGWAADGQTITVSFRGEKVSTTARHGRWLVKLRSPDAGGPDTLTVSSTAGTIQLSNVLVGEVWICSGQSNMEWPLKKAFAPEADVAAATNSQIRFFTVPNVRSDVPLSDVPKTDPAHELQRKWLVCTPESAAAFSAVGYYFARDLHTARNVPIGLIQSDWGGTPAEAWTSLECLESNSRYKSEIVDPYPGALSKYHEALAAWEKEKAEAEKNKQEFKKWAPWRPWKPAELYNAMIAPLIPYAFKGVIWYQGESNANRAHQYRSLFPDMIHCWRRSWGQGEFPFLFVQLAPFKAIQQYPRESDWAELREAQLLTIQEVPRTAMAVITDVGDEKDIHPSRKQPVGARLALAARAIAYEEPVVYSGPTFKEVKFNSGAAIVSFNHVGGGLHCSGSVVRGFAVSGEDRKFYWAVAEIQGDNTVRVSSPNVPQPVAVRFGWADYPVVNLWNKEGLPASPFRSDDFPLTTGPASQTAMK